VSRRHYLRGLDATLRGAALPYGYTLTTWCSGLILDTERGQPAVWLAVCYVAGATAGFGLLKAAARDARPTTNAMQLADDSHVVRAGAAHVTGIAAALTAVWLIGHIGSGVDWLLGGFAATVLYLCGTAAELGLRERESA
jgi:hypothetical protein